MRCYDLCVFNPMMDSYGNSLPEMWRSHPLRETRPSGLGAAMSVRIDAIRHTGTGRDRSAAQCSEAGRYSVTREGHEDESMLRGAGTDRQEFEHVAGFTRSGTHSEGNISTARGLDGPRTGRESRGKTRRCWWINLGSSFSSKGTKQITPLN